MAGRAARLIAGLVVISAVSSLSAGVAGADGDGPQWGGGGTRTLFVATSGTDAAGCGSASAPCRTISFALGEAPAGATIRVGPGTYAEQLVIHQPVRIKGAGPSETVVEPASVPVADSDSDSSVPEQAVVDVTPGTTRVALSDLGIDGSAASSAFDATGCANDFVGVYFHDASGSLDDVAVTGVALPTALFGCQDGLGVYVTTDPASTTASQVDMSGLVVTGYDKNGITCDDIGTVCSIRDSVVTGSGPTPLIAQNGIQLWAASGSIENDIVTANSYTDPLYDGPGGSFTSSTGILVINPAGLDLRANRVGANDDNVYLLEDAAFTPPAVPPLGDIDVVDNDLSGAVNNSGTAPGSSVVPFGDGIGDGIDLDSTGPGVSVEGNAANHDAEYGVALLGASGAEVRGDTAEGSGDGFFVGGPGSAATQSSANVVTLDTASDSADNGFLVSSDATGNTFLDDSATSDADTDATDASIGSGSDGTANSWMADLCPVSSPVGLCTGHRGHGGPPPFHPFGGHYGGFAMAS